MAGYIIALTGASGAVYGLRLIEELLKRGDDVELVISPSGFLLLKEEAGIDCEGKDVAKAILKYFKKTGRAGSRKKPFALTGRLNYTPSNNLYSRLASGSSLYRAMVICPCSMGTLARISSGISGNLIERAADCVLKEGGRLVLVPRETPLNAIHLENMLRLARMGVTMLPAMPAFYTAPRTVEDMVDFVVGKALDSLGVENRLYGRWKGPRK
ncbi:MAG: UbiX family flavin prenyltransferase [Deltaproteobacteria bacterium]|nr:UbiX family flavin prenyltransferase [Deltaproteobacteria bacterium]